MTRDELNIRRLVKEAQENEMRMHTRRHFLKESAMGLGALGIGYLLGSCGVKNKTVHDLSFDPVHPLLPKAPPMFAKAKSVIYLHMAGAPSQLELFDYKPELSKMDGQDCPPSLIEGKNFAFIRGIPKMLGPQAKFAQRGQSGAWISDHFPHLATVADEITFLKSSHNRSIQSRARAIINAYRQCKAGPPQHGFLDHLWIGNRKSKSAGVCGIDERGKFSRCRQKCLGKRIFAFRIPGSAMPQRGRPGVVYQ
jgi:hypothetical protein